MSKSMKAMILGAPREIGIEDVSRPDPGPGQVRIRLEGCGVCASNLPVWQGRPWFDYPFRPGTPGHEGFGWVDALGEGVRGLAEGQRVAFLSAAAYAEYDVTNADSVLPLPESLDGTPFPGEPFACAMNIFRRSHIAAGHTVAVVGVGFLGACLVRLASFAGARVIAISRREFALDVARRMGASEVIPMTERQDVVGAVSEVTEGRLCDRVVEAVGAQGPLTLAGKLTGVRGRLVVAGYHQESPREVDMQLWNWRGIDVANAHEREPVRYLEGMREAIHAVEGGVLDPSVLLTDSWALEDAAGAFAALEERPSGFLKGWLVMEA